MVHWVMLFYSELVVNRKFLVKQEHLGNIYSKFHLIKNVILEHIIGTILPLDCQQAYSAVGFHVLQQSYTTVGCSCWAPMQLEIFKNLIAKSFFKSSLVVSKKDVMHILMQVMPGTSSV